jgi:hypothetical protein
MRPAFPDQIIAQPCAGLIAEDHVLSREMQVHYPSVSGRSGPLNERHRYDYENDTSSLMMCAIETSAGSGKRAVQSAKK